ncbi:MAG TPA: aminotransferase [Caulobacteraceae bacterium]|nr:aminotransferase [Caulobacteraceae bacterium]
MDDMRRNRTLEDIDRESYFHPVTAIADHLARGATVMESGAGVRVKDHTGKTYLDAMAGLWCVNVGYGRQELADAAATVLADLGYFHSFASMANEPIIRLADKVLQLLRDEAGQKQMSRVFFANSGSEANDTAFKLARYVNNLRGRPEKKKIIGRLGGYHGVGLGAGSVTGIPAYHKAFDLPLPGVLHVSCPHYYGFGLPGESEADFSARLVAELEETIAREGGETIAAFFAEPVIGAGGVFLPPVGYFEGVQKLLKAHDILFVADEVICGFGRLGAWFGSGLHGLKPDLLTFAKGITSGYFPTSGVAVAKGVWETLADTSPEMGAFAHGFTYSGHPVGGAIGLANLAIIEREGLVANAAAMGPRLVAALEARVGGHPNVGQVRGQGLVAAVEIVKDRETREKFETVGATTRKIAAAAFERGLITRPVAFGEANVFAPPLIIGEKDIDEIADLYGAALEEVLGT